MSLSPGLRNREWHMRKSIFVPLTALSLVLILAEASLSTSRVFAQNPNSWQTGATGLQTQSNPDKKTAGLGFIVQDQGWPFLSLQGGVKKGNQGNLSAAGEIQLGQVKSPGTSGAFSSETADWAHNEVTFTNGSSQLNLWVSRLTAAILIQYPLRTIRLFSGSVSGYQQYNNQSGQLDIRSISGPSSPKYVAYQSSSGVTVQALSPSSISLGLTSNWLLLWYGNNSTFVDTKRPMSYDSTIPISDSYQADKPILLLFQNRPSSINQSSEGGVDITFPSSAGYLSILPLFGIDVLQASATEGWAKTFPGSVQQKITFWSNHLCSYPVTAAESYSYDSSTDSATMGESITFLTACSQGVILAPIPPMLGIAKDALGVGFSGTVVDGNLPTEFGPSMGIEGTVNYTWSIWGLMKYTDSKRIITNTGSSPPEIDQQLASQVDQLVSAGHMALGISWTPSHDTRSVATLLGQSD